MMREDELKQQIAQIEARLCKVEELLKAPSRHVKPAKKYEGLAGGIRRLLDKGFFETPKTLNEVIDELKREGYKLSVSGVASTLSVTFTHKQRSLTRIKDKEGWKYKRRGENE
jgi:hypothetical protein